MASIQVNNYRNGHGGFGRSNGNNKQGKENTIQFIGVQVFIECHKIYVHTIQNQLYGHEHSDKVTPGEQSIHADEKQGRAHKQDMC
jgi:hypothetical protein